MEVWIDPISHKEVGFLLFIRIAKFPSTLRKDERGKELTKQENTLIRGNGNTFDEIKFLMAGKKEKFYDQGED